MGVPTSEVVGYTSATTRRGDHQVHIGHVVALAKKKNIVPVASCYYFMNFSCIAVVKDERLFLFFHRREVCHCIKNSAQENNKPDFPGTFADHK
jgi:hypothetical protein